MTRKQARAYQHRHPMYDEFDKIAEIMSKVHEMHGKNGVISYWKMVFSGSNPPCADYQRGVLCAEVKILENVEKDEDRFCVRFVISSVDDGAVGGWFKYTTREKASNLANRIKLEIIEPMYMVPSLDDLRAMMLEYGTFMEVE